MTALPVVVDLTSDDDADVGPANPLPICPVKKELSDGINPAPRVSDFPPLLGPPPGFAPPLCREFWKAGEYNVGPSTRASMLNGSAHIRVHPKFLHSNATSHTWVFGAIAELLDNAVDEIPNGATFVRVDKITNLLRGSPALLIQDDGGGMCPDIIRRCMSFGFSCKSMKSAIGQYGNGFKTSTMRLGSDAIVFTRCSRNRVLTQSVGLLSYTFLTRTGIDDVVVPMVDYIFNPLTKKYERMLLRMNEDCFSSNLSVLMEWSPYASEADLLKQFDDLGEHGTKVVIFNLWLNDSGDLELDFDTDPQDILVNGAADFVDAKRTATKQHLAVRFRYSLRHYASILYLRIRETFQIILCGRLVEYHNVVDDLKFREYILYKPTGGTDKEMTVTTIGFIKEAPHANIHGFTLYHKGRLILPFWPVVHGNSKGKGVVGVLEANFIEPTHDKQGFERTTLYNKLECRLKQMTVEYWDYHCELIGYKARKAPPQASPTSLATKMPGNVVTPSPYPAITLCKEPDSGGKIAAANPGRSSQNEKSRLAGSSEKRKHYDSGFILNSSKKGTSIVDVVALPRAELAAPASTTSEIINHHEDLAPLIQINKKLHSQCLVFEKQQTELRLLIQHLRQETDNVNIEYERLRREAISLGAINS